MLHLMRLELKKIHIGNYILAVILSIFAGMFLIFVALHDTSEGTDTFADTFRVIEMIFSFVFVMLFSVLNSTVIINEYNCKTILTLFTYPVDRRKVILAKLMLVTSFVAVSMLAGYAACGSYVVGMDHWFDWIEGEFQLSILCQWICRGIITIVVFCCLGLWTFVVGMWKKSVPMAIVSSVLFIFMRQVVVASTDDYQESIWFLFFVLVITGVGMWYTFSRKVAQAE